MTLGYRAKCLRRSPKRASPGSGCVTSIEWYGREVYNDMDPRNGGRGRRVSATRAQALQRMGGSLCFARVDGRWRIARASLQSLLDCRSKRTPDSLCRAEATIPPRDSPARSPRGLASRRRRR